MTHGFGTMNRIPVALAVPVAGLCCALAGCSTRTDVSVTGNTPAQYSHVWITAQEVWFNTSSIAGPDDGGWVKFPLSTPATVDLVTESGGNLGSLVTGLKLAPGTYSQIRLIPVDAAAALTSSAQTLGALYNAEADYVDSANTTHQLPLELLNPDQGIGIPGTLKVPVGNVGAALSATTATTTTTGTTTTPTTPTTPNTSPTTTTTTTFAITFDGTRDLTPFSYAGATTPNAILLSSHASAFDLSEVGGIQGQLTLTNLTATINSAAGLPAIQVSAQSLSADGTRHVVVSRAPVHADGSFLLYPLATSSSSPADYDLVIHGRGIATIIIKSVQVTLASSSASGTTSTGTAANSTINAVSVGTLIPRAAGSYTANVGTATGAALPAGAQVGFYQTLATAGEVPYVIEASPIDPFNETLANAQALSTGTLDSGTYSTSGASVTLVSAAPKEGAGHYRVAASAPSFTDGALTTTVSAPPAGTTTPVAVTVPALALAPGTTAGSISASVTQATAGKYDHGELLVTHDGTLIATTPLDAALAQGAGATLTVSGLPAGTAAALYYVAVRAWNSRDASGTLQRQSYPTAIDLSGSTTGAAQLTIN
ncbi:MAG: DUF4382 domain-containing protein [Gammaproteobacteria bacterium]|nr:MAG: DUF4382 domain-containing protein [Gammaproteobacteria bacterium]